MKTILAACPACRKPTKPIDAFTLRATDGPSEHLKVRCESGHIYTVRLDN